jgi:hypothetical protein
MRMRDQLIIVAAMVFATLSLVVAGYASTRAAIERGNEAAFSVPLRSLPLAAAEISKPLESPPTSDRPVQPESPSTVCYGAGDCAAEPRGADDYKNHGQYVSANVSETIVFLRELENFDGPPGAFIREFARPNVATDRPPRADQAEESSSKDKDDDKKAPPGLNKDKNDKDDDS